MSVGCLRVARTKPEYAQYFVAGRVDVLGLQPFIQDLLALDAAEQENSSDYWKKRKLKADAQTSEIELDEMRKKFLDKDDVIVFLKQIASSQRALLRSKMVHELPSKLLGLGATDMSVVMETELNEILNLFQSGLNTWTK